MLDRVEQYMLDNSMTEPGDRLVVGVSGGADSVCLLHILCELRESLDISLVACHVMHGIRGEEAERDASFVEDFCGFKGVPLRLFRRDVPRYASETGMTLEEAGRYMRRQIFSQVMEEEGAQKIALAHHRDDLAETVLMNCARGTGIRGLAALRPVRGAYIRPLMCAGRDEIEDLLAREGIAYCTDSTNADLTMTRNAVRGVILPEMEKYVNSRVTDHLAELSRDAGEVSDFLDAECERRRADYVTEEEDGWLIAVAFARRENHLMQTLIVRSVLRNVAGTEKDITRRHVEDILDLAEKLPGKSLDLPYGMWAVKRDGGVYICRKNSRVSEKPKEEILLGEGTYRIAGGTLSVQISACEGPVIPQNMYTKAFDYDKIKGILKLRTRLPGDFIVINPDGRRKSFSNYLTDIKAAHDERDRIPVVACGKEILWAIGFRSGESCRLDMHSKRMLVMTYKKDNTEE